MQSEAESSAQSKSVVLFVAAISAFINPFLNSSISVALPSIGREFALDAVTLSWITTAYLLVGGVCLVPVGRLADIHGRKRLWMAGTVFCAAFSLLCALAPTGLWLIATRALQAVGATVSFGTGTSILTSVFPQRERGKALGINVAAVYMGLSVGPFLGGVLIGQWGWRSIFLATIPAGLLAAGLMQWGLKGEWAEARGESFDLTGSVLYGLALASLMYGVSLLPAGLGVVVAVGGVLGLVAFVAWELRAASPVLDVRLFQGNPVFAWSNAAAFINYAATTAVTFLLSLYLQYIHGLEPVQAGLVLLVQPVLMTAISLVAGRLSDRFEPRLVASAGMAVTAVSLLMLAALDDATALAFIVVSLVLQGIGFGLFSSPNTNAIMSAVGRRSYGVASGTVGTMRITGQMASMGVAMTLLAIHLGRAPVSAENHDAFLVVVRTAFLIFAVLCGLGVLASLVRGKVRASDEAAPELAAPEPRRQGRA